MTQPKQSEELLIELAGSLIAEQSLEKALRQILDLACTVLPGGDEGGITLLDAEGPGTVISTGGAALRVDNSQYDTEAGGPGLEAYRRQRILRIDSTARDQRWPAFVAAAAAEGFRSALSVPLVVGGDGLGALNIYCRHEYGFPLADERLAGLVGSCASVALANARTYWRGARLADQLQQVLSSRGVVEQAVGVLIAQRSCSAEQARHLLAAAAQRHHLALAEVAADLVQRTGQR